jgi:crossover junction endodeoxyribonuclease RusA
LTLSPSQAKAIRVELPWPSRDLHPNARVHWAVRARAAKKARADGVKASWAAGLRGVAAEALSVTVTFYPPNRRAHDVDGLLSSVKSYLDGIADVTGVDDRNWRIVPVKADVRPGGAVVVDLEPVDTWEHISGPAARVVASIPMPKRGAA